MSRGGGLGGRLGGLLLAVLAALPGCEPATTSGQSRASAAGRSTVPALKTGPERPAPDSAVRAVRVVAAPSGAPDFEVPQVQLVDVAVARRINQTLTHLLLTANLQDTRPAADPLAAVRRAQVEFRAGGQSGLTGTSYDVLLNRPGLLSLALHTEYLGAYPSTATQHATFSTRTGRLLTLPELVADTLALRRQWHRRLNRRLAAHLRSVARDYPADATAGASVRYYTHWNDTTHTVRPAGLPELRDFALTQAGLVLFTNFEFAHVVQALSPDEAYLISYAQLKPWLGARSPLRGLR